MKEFFERFKKLRTGHNLSQSKIAACLGVKEKTVLQWENGERLPRVKQAVKIKKFFDVLLDYLLGLADDE